MHFFSKRAIFIGADPVKFGSVRIRCIEIARYVGCTSIVAVNKSSDIPAGYNVFICVKTNLPADELKKLSSRGPIIWDVVDIDPPKYDFISFYIVSTQYAKSILGLADRTIVIPHYHCNFSGIPNQTISRVPAWIGGKHWYPEFDSSIKHVVYFSDGLARSTVARSYRAVGVLLNFRNLNFPDVTRHTQLNSGIKMINAIGFGIPSISAQEPAYEEIGPDCTVFCDISDISAWIREYEDNGRLYAHFRKKCVRLAKKYHIGTVSKMYKSHLKI